MGLNKKYIIEATGSGSSGHFKVPIVLAPEAWPEDQLAPFNIHISIFADLKNREYFVVCPFE